MEPAAVANDADKNVKRPSVPPARQASLRHALWAVSLFASIAVGGLIFWPGLAGRAILSLIFIGFALFTVARSSLGVLAEAPSSCAPLLRPRMRAMYWAGYALMFSGIALTALASLTSLARLAG